MTTSYAKFATVYDELMTDVPYDTYAGFIELAANGIKGKKVLDIGCGTGILAAKLAKLGGEVTAVDLSPHMLEVARNRAKSLRLPITFVNQPMERLEGFKDFDVAVIPIDSLNYVTKMEDVQATFRGVYDSLRPGGVLLFDVHSTFKTDVIFMEGPFVYDDGRIAYMWQTDEGDAPHSVYSALSFFVETDSGLYERFDEVHVQRTFPVHLYVELLEEAGFKIERIFSDWEDEAPWEECERIFFQVRK